MNLDAHTLEEVLSMLRCGEPLPMEPAQHPWRSNREVLIKWLVELAALRRFRYATEEARQYLPR